MAHRTKPVGTVSELIELVGVTRRLDLDDHDPGERFGWEKEPAKAALDTEVQRLAVLQKLLFAEGRDHCSSGSIRLDRTERATKERTSEVATLTAPGLYSSSSVRGDPEHDGGGRHVPVGAPRRACPGGGHGPHGCCQ